jgi:hypothetical protein
MPLIGASDFLRALDQNFVCVPGGRTGNTVVYRDDSGEYSRIGGNTGVSGYATGTDQRTDDIVRYLNGGGTPDGYAASHPTPGGSAIWGADSGDGGGD